MTINVDTRQRARDLYLQGFDVRAISVTLDVPREWVEQQLWWARYEAARLEARDLFDAYYRRRPQ